MTEVAQGYSFVQFDYVKGDRLLSIPFPYLRKSDIRVFAGSAGDAVELVYEWDNEQTIKFHDAGLPEGVLLTVRRFTRRDKLLVTYTDGAQLPAGDLNLSSKQLLYILQEQIDYGSGGGSGLPGGGAGWPPAGGGTSLELQQIIDQLMQSPVFQLLVSSIEDSQQTAETILQELLRSDEAYDFRRLSEARHGENLAAVNLLTQTIASETEARATAILQVTAKVNENAADILDARQAIATETEARSAAILQVTAKVNENASEILDVRQAVTTETEARAAAITDVRAAALGASARVEERFEAMVRGAPDPSADPLWSANWTVRLNATPINGTPVIAGIGLGIDSETGSNFIVMADRFGIVSPAYTENGGVSQMKFPFVVGTVGGVSTVGITGQLIVDGSVTADKLKVNSLSAITANMGEVNGGTFRTFRLDANGAIIDPLEFRVEITNNPADSYPLWIGSGVKNANNAVMWVDRAGNSKFAGTVSALNITDQLQAQNTFSWTGDIRANVGGVAAVFSLPAPVKLGQVHTPVILAEVFYYGSDDDGSAAADGFLSFERFDGSTWVPIRTTKYSVYKFITIPASLVLADAPTSSAQQYRIRVTGGNMDFHLTAINGYIFGLR